MVSPQPASGAPPLQLLHSCTENLSNLTSLLLPNITFNLIAFKRTLEMAVFNGHLVACAGIRG